MSVLSSQQIRALLDGPAPIVSDMVDADKQVQANGVDLTLDSIESLTTGGRIGLTEAEGVAATTLKALDKGRLYVLPQVDARLIWRAKRYLPATYARGAGLLSRFTLAKP